MFRHIAWFEIRFWLRSWMLWIFLFFIALVIIGATAWDEVTVGLGLSNIYRNAPDAIATYYARMGALTLLLTGVFVNAAALRDFTCNAYRMTFSLPIKKRDFLLGRFVGATLVSVVPMLGISVAILLGRYLPFVDRPQWGPVNWPAHFKSILLFAVPNAFIAAAILFAVAVIWRRDIASFVAAIILFTGNGIAGLILQDSKREYVAALFDPFCMRTFAAATKYWTVAERNTQSVGFGGVLMWNRLIWIGIGFAGLALSYAAFSFAERRTKARTPEPYNAPGAVQALDVRPNPRITGSHWARFLGSFRLHFAGMAKNTAFVVIVIIASVFCVLAFVLASTLRGNHTFPVTYQVIELIRDTLSVFLIIIVTYFSGALVWKDRDERVDQITDATPTAGWVSYAARLATLVAMVVLIQAVALGAGIINQAVHGYTRFQFGLYVHELLVRDTSWVLFFAVLAFLIQALAPNKYVGYFAFIVFLLFNTYVWGPLNIATNLVQFAARPNVIYSDFFGNAPYRSAWNWFTVYWLLFSVMLAIATVMLWPRGTTDRWQSRWHEAALRFGRGWKAIALLSLLAFAGCGIWIWYNTEVLNHLPGPNDSARIQADYEKTYKPMDKLPQPRLHSVRYAIDIFPSNRNADIQGDEVIYNPYSYPLDEVHFTLDPLYDTAIDVPGAAIAKDDSRLSYQIYRFTSPLQPREERTIHFSVRSKNRGFENNVSNHEIVQNGTFINNFTAPAIGYNYLRELDDALARKKYGLQETDLMPPLEPNCTEDCREPRVPGHSDWLDVDTILSTTPDQIAIAPGSLVREWREGDRRYYEYQLDHPSMNSFGFLSGTYEVAREDWNGIKLEVYYLKQHAWNVPTMLHSMKKSLDYYIENYGPYAHKEARIIEFPRVANFAQSFASTMPYSEALGFISDLSNPDDINIVFYVVAHEMAHQWWFNQVEGAKMEGATLLSETLAQYSALMVMEREYGRDMMRKFLAYEMDEYLRSRGQERLKERPLITVESQQSYIHYRKGAVVMYYLKEMIGEAAVNRALRKLVERYGYALPPYPTSYALVDALRNETPADLQRLIKDLFEDIVLFSNRTFEASAVKRPDGKYDVTIDVEVRKFKADENGKETEVPIDDWIDIGAFAKPVAGKKYGDTLYRERVHINERDSSFTFTTSELPEKAGIDPFALLIDRLPDDNMKKVTLNRVRSF